MRARGILECFLVALVFIGADGAASATQGSALADSIAVGGSSSQSGNAEVQAAQAQASVQTLRKSAATDYWAAETVPFTSVTAIITSIGTAAGGVAVSLLVVIAIIAIIPGVIRGIRQGGFNITLPQIGTISIPAAVNRLQSASVPPPVPPTLPPSTSAPVQTPEVAPVASATDQAAAGLRALGADLVAPANVTPSWSTAVDSYYSAFYHMLTASQLTLLNQLKDGPLVLAAARSIYQNTATSRGNVSSFGDWLDYPERYGMAVVTKGDNARLSITDRGMDFLKWATATGHSLARLTNENRYF